MKSDFVVVVIVEEDFIPNHLAITTACVIGFFVVALYVSLNVVEVGLSALEFIPWRS